MGNKIRKAEIAREKNCHDNQKPDHDDNHKAPYVFSFFGYMFAQLVSHDIANRAMTRLTEHQCCRNQVEIGLARELSSSGCLPISVPHNDPFYSKYNVTCLNFVRTYPILPSCCKFGATALASTTTAYIDLSILYSNSKEQLDTIRTFDGGRIKTNEQDVLPVDSACDPTVRRDCFILGDSRINQTPFLALLHSLMLRLHNRNAYELAKVNPKWSDEKLFRESRRITIAVHQNIVFHEWLPLLLGKRASYHHGILCKETSKCRQYDKDVDAKALSDFMQGVYRALHVCTPNITNNYDRYGKKVLSYKMSEIIGVTDVLNYQYNDILRGMLIDGITCKQLFYTEEVLNSESRITFKTDIIFEFITNIYSRFAVNLAS